VEQSGVLVGPIIKRIFQIRGNPEVVWFKSHPRYLEKYLFPDYLGIP
jgi:hypothetical protein